MPPFVRLLGRASIRIGDRAWEPPADRRSALLYYVAASAGWVPRDDLLYLFWPDSEEQKGRANLRQLLVSVRSLPFAGDLEVERTRVCWPVSTDLQAWNEAVARGDGDLVWPGAMLEGFRLASAPEFESWLELERAAWHDRGRAAILAQAARAAGAGEFESAATLLDGWLVHAPLDEEALRTWLELSGRTGRHTAAYARFAAFEMRLASEMGLAPERATAEVAETLRWVRGDAVPRDAAAGSPRTQLRSPGQVPQGRSVRARTGGSRRGFVGRAAELERLEAQLLEPGGPLVTILGAGGMGKTRLALEAADRVGARFAGGVAIAWLAGAATLDQVGPALVEALGVEPIPLQPPLEQVVAALRGERMLIVLDNVEQLEGIGEFVSGLRRDAPDVAWLITSRERLGLRDEVVIEIQGLPFPSDPVEAASMTAGAVELLRQRARRTGHEIDLAADAEAVVRVCRLTAGMPLALELAAGWLRVLPLAAIADELEASLDVLAAADGDVDARHASMRAVFDASWRALPHAERVALVRLAAFRGGFTERAAREVTDVGRPLLLALRNKSFLSLDATGRFFQHPLLEAYVRERASEDEAAWAEARERHAAWFCTYLATWEDAGQADRHGEANRALSSEHANLEAAWAYALDHGWWDALKKGGASLGLSYQSVGRPLRWVELLRAALARVPQGTSAWAVLEVHEASVDEFQGRHQVAFERRRRAVETLRRHDDPFSLAWGLLLLAESAWSVGRLDQARADQGESARIFESLGEMHLLGMALGKLHALTDDPVERERLFERCVANARQTGHRGNDADVLRDHADFVAHTHGDYGVALELVDRAVAIERHEAWSPQHIADGLRIAARIRLATGDLEVAAQQAGEALALWPPYRTFFPQGEAEAQVLLATAAWLRGDAAAAEGIVAPGSAAGSTLEGVLLRCEMAGARGDLVVARGCADQALAMAAPPRIGRRGQLERVTALLRGAGAALALGEPGVAQRELSEALAIATAWRFLPGLLEACAEATGLLAAEMAAEVRGWVAGHPAAPFALRRRLAGAAFGLTVPASDREAAWREALGWAGRVASALEVGRADG